MGDGSLPAPQSRPEAHRAAQRTYPSWEQNRVMVRVACNFGKTQERSCLWSKAARTWGEPGLLTSLRIPIRSGQAGPAESG